MKKLLLVLLTLTLVVGLGACDSSSPAFDDSELELQIEELEARVIELEAFMGRIGFVQGLNGIEVPYLIPQSTIVKLSYTPLGEDIKVKDDDFDKYKTAPLYITDEIGNYISFEEVSKALKLKYFPIVINGLEVDTYYMESICGMNYFNYAEEIVLEDTIARTILLIQELQQYSFYVLSSNQVVIRYFDMSLGTPIHFEITIPLVVIVNDFFDITADKVVNGFYEMELTVTNYEVNNDLVIQYYDSYVLEGTFNGYVLTME